MGAPGGTPVQHAIAKQRDGDYQVAFRNLTAAEAAQFLELAARIQQAREEQPR
jgi:hypothetical protein